MNTFETESKYLTLERAELIEEISKRIFALKCISVGCLVQEEIAVGHSIIDFLVINPKRLEHEETLGKLVEVTMMSKLDLMKNKVHRRVNGRKRRVLNKSGIRKQRQIESMIQSEYPWTILYGEHIGNIVDASKSESVD